MPPGSGRAIGQFVLKVHGGCNLACDHCYVYRHADQSWRTKPHTMSSATAARVGDRIAEHAIAHELPRVRVILHGGEPLLLGSSRLREIIEILHSRTDSAVKLIVYIQTNAVTLNERFCRLFGEYGVQVGVSLDGGRSENDRHRLFANGRSSHHLVTRSLSLLRRPEFRHLYGGILCTVDLANDPIGVYEALLAESPPQLDFLLPHATWENPPPGHGELPAPYAAWLGRIHARWDSDGRPVPIRLFDALASASRGEPSGSEAVGLGPVDLAVVDTDGSWEQVDSLKTAYAGAPATGMSVFTHSVDSLGEHAGIAARRDGLAGLCAKCRSCPVVRTCGGGLYTHRYRADNGFDNPSVYCADLMQLALRVTRAPAERTRPVAHQLPDGAFDAFAAGPGSVGGTYALLDTELSQTRALVAGLAPSEARSGARSGEGWGAVASAGWELLAELDTSQRAATEQVLGHPCVRSWASRCLRLRRDSEGDPGRDRAHIAGVAAAVAWRSGTAARLPLPVTDGLIHLPGVGAFRTAEEGPVAMVSLDGSGSLPGEWIQARQLTAPALSATLDDLDPYRDGRGRVLLGRLSGWSREVWRTALVEAGDELSRLVPQYASTLRAGLRTVVPVRGGATGHDRGGARSAFGGVALAAHEVVGDPSAALIHAYQRTTMSALLDLYRLFDPAESPLLTVPWRPHPLPVEGALRDLYGYVALAELWRARTAVARTAVAGGATFRRYREWVDITVDTLLSKAALTPDGLRFAAGLRATTDRFINIHK